MTILSSRLASESFAADSQKSSGNQPQMNADERGSGQVEICDWTARRCVMLLLIRVFRVQPRPPLYPVAIAPGSVFVDPL